MMQIRYSVNKERKDVRVANERKAIRAEKKAIRDAEAEIRAAAERQAIRDAEAAERQAIRDAAERQAIRDAEAAERQAIRDAEAEAAEKQAIRAEQREIENKSISIKLKELSLNNLNTNSPSKMSASANLKQWQLLDQYIGIAKQSSIKVHIYKSEKCCVCLSDEPNEFDNIWSSIETTLAPETILFDKPLSLKDAERQAAINQVDFPLLLTGFSKNLFEIKNI
jgi:hypothetical protein